METVTLVTEVTLWCIQQMKTDIAQDFEYCRVVWQKEARAWCLHCSGLLPENRRVVVIRASGQRAAVIRYKMLS